MTRARTGLLGLLALVALAIVALLVLDLGRPPAPAEARAEESAAIGSIDDARVETTSPIAPAPSAESPGRAREALADGRGDLPVLVRDRDTGEPLAGVPVELWRSDSGATRTASTEQDGRCRFADLEPGGHELRTGSTEAVEYACDPTPVAVEAGVHETVVLLVERRWFLAGVVVEAGSGEPVPGVDLTARAADGKHTHVGTSAAGGRFRSRRSYAAGRIDLSMSEEDTWGLMRTHGPGPELLAVEVGHDDVAHLRVGIDWIGVLRGIVLDPHDRPVAGAGLRVLGGDSIYLGNASLRFWGLYEALRRQGRTVRSDAEGRFAFARLPNDRTLVVVASPPEAGPGLASVRSADLSPPFRASDEPVVLRLSEGGSIAGTVRDAQGEPLEGIVVTALSTEPAYPPDPTRTDAEGAYRLAGVVPGATEVSAVAAETDGSRHAIAGGEVEVVAGREVRLDLVAGADGVHLSGVAVDQHGRVLTSDRARLSLRTQPLEPRPGEPAWGFDSPVKDDGSFDVTVPRAGPYRLALLGILAGDPWQSQDVRAPARDLRLEFPVAPTGEIEIRALDDATGEPIDQGSAAIAWDRGSLSQNFYGGGTTWTIREGVYTITVDAKGYAPASKRLDLRGRMQPRTVVELRLDRGRPVTGVVRDDGGRPVKGCTVVLQVGGMLQTENLAYAGEDGRFTIAAAPTTGGSLCVIDEAYRTLASAEIGAGEVVLTIASN